VRAVNQLPASTHRAARPYAVLYTATILRLPPPPSLADPAVLFLQRLASMQRDARDVARTRCRRARRTA
jgi:hypothetical protein